MVVQPRHDDAAIGVLDRVGTQVDVGRCQLFDQRAQGVAIAEPRDLVAELEVLEDLLHVRRKAVQVRFEVGPQLLALARALRSFSVNGEVL